MSKIDQFQEMVNLRKRLLQIVMNDQFHVSVGIDYNSESNPLNHFIAVHIEVINDAGIWEIPNQDILSLFSMAINRFKERMIAGAIYEADLLINQYAREAKDEAEHVLNVLRAHEKAGSAATDPTKELTKIQSSHYTPISIIKEHWEV